MFRFTIRELVLLTLVVGMGVGWWIDHRVQRALLDAVTDQWAADRNRSSDVQFETTP